MEFLLELSHDIDEPFTRTITNVRPNVGDIIKVDGKEFKIIDCKLRQDFWINGGIICFLCKIKEKYDCDVLGRISIEIAKNSPLKVSRIEAENSGGFGFDKGDLAHDDTYFYLTLGSFEVVEPVSLYLEELEGEDVTGSLFDLSIELYDGEELLINRTCFSIKLSYPWMISPYEMKAKEGQLWTIVEAVIKKGALSKFDKYFEDRLSN